MVRLPNSPDLIIHHGRIFTADEQEPRAKAVAVRKHRIVAVGNNVDVLELAGKKTRVIDAGGDTLLPGLCDSHIHFGPWSLGRLALQIADAGSQAELLARLGERAAATPPGQWIVASGWNESRWGVSEFPTAADLDAVTGPERPTLLYRSDLHVAVANRAALNAAGITAATTEPEAGRIDRDAAGNPTGVLREHAIDIVDAVIPEATPTERLHAMRLGIAHLQALGVTAIHDQRYGARGEGAAMLRAFQTLRDEGRLGLRVTCNVAAGDLGAAVDLGIRSGFGDDTLQIGHLKFFADGSLGSRTAWMLAPFDGEPGERPNYGMAMLETAELAQQVTNALRAGFAVSIHAIGDRANHEVLDVLEEAIASTPPVALPHRIEHVQTIDRADAPRLAPLDITASVQPLHLLDDMELADRLLGPRTATTYAFRTLLEQGTRLAFGSDAPVADPNPWLGLYAAVARTRPGQPASAAWRPEQTIDLADAIRAYTIAPAHAVARHAALGSISVGKRADMILLDRDLFAVDEIATTRVRLTLFDGEVVYEA